ncbi:MAG: histidine kinase, partial [Synergistaceae bacterium]|nr:histidine kinase [Synergistaceae bacterium]
MLRRKLLAILFICILLPVLVILFQSASTLVSQKKSTTEISGRYVESLANYAADRWNEGNIDRLNAFLSLVADQGYNRLISAERSDSLKQDRNAMFRRNMKGKFIPGLVAYVTSDGRLISYSQNAAVLINIYERAALEIPDDESEGHVVGSIRVGSEYITYVAHMVPTDDPRVYAVAAVTMLSWMGRNDFNMMTLAAAGIMGMLICLVALFLLRRSVITPLQALSSQVNTLKWGKEVPRPQAEGEGVSFGRMQIEEISSLRHAIFDLARRMIEKDELEIRYLGDIIKAQELERGRIAQDIHDGPIQVVSALIQRIQIANITSGDLPESARDGLSTAESIAGDLVEDLRDICDSLVPPWVSLGIVSCMEEAASRFERQHSITINMSVDQTLEISQEATLALFRIFQEAVSNAVRHGGATEVNVDVRPISGDRSVEFIVSDNGSGFDPRDKIMSDLVRDGKRGLNGMRQRVEFLNGDYELWSKPGDGT